MSGDGFRHLQAVMFCNVPIPSDDIFYAKRLSRISSYLSNKIFVVSHGFFIELPDSGRVYALSFCAALHLVPLS